MARAGNRAAATFWCGHSSMGVSHGTRGLRHTSHGDNSQTRRETLLLRQPRRSFASIVRAKPGRVYRLLGMRSYRHQHGVEVLFGSRQAIGLKGCDAELGRFSCVGNCLFAGCALTDAAGQAGVLGDPAAILTSARQNLSHDKNLTCSAHERGGMIGPLNEP